MNLTDDQIVKILIAKYKQEGIDLAYVVQDPVFMALPLSSKIDALKKYAQELSSGTSAKFKISDLKPIGIASGFGAVGGFLSAPKLLRAASSISDNTLARRMINSRASIYPKALGAVAGAVVGATGAFFDNYDKRQNRYSMKRTLSAISNDPTDNRAVYGLSSLQRKRDPSEFSNRLYTLLQNRLDESNTTEIPRAYLSQIKELKELKNR